jgi:putative MFS transporter
MESGMFEQARRQGVRRGSLLHVLWPPARLRRYLSVILVGLPIWYVVGILIVLAPELGAALGTRPAPTGADAVMFCYAGLAVGDLASGVVSQLLGSRRKVLGGALILTAATMAVYFTVAGHSLATFYATCAALGVATGYWAVFVTVASEQFGTNIRATVTTTVPNFVRGAVVAISSGVLALRPRLGLVGSAATVGAVTLALAFIALANLDETFGKSLDYLEPGP